jgi:hypothetical protein
VTTPHDDLSLLTQFLAGRDQACPQCGYNLRDLTGMKCPECGEELALRVQPVEPRQAAALTGLIGLTAGAGMNALLLGYAFLMIVFMNRANQPWWHPFITTNAGGFVVMGTSTALWLKYWRHIRRLGPVRRWALACACAMLSLADLIVFAKLVR